MRFKFLILLLYILSIISAQAQNPRSVLLYFNTNEYQLTPDHLRILDSIAEMINKENIDSVFITGHTDNVGTDAYNLQLSKKRSLSVFDYLNKKATDRKFTTSWLGESVPLLQSDLVTSVSRRVEVAWNIDTNGEGYINDLKELYSLLAPKPQEFCIQANRDTLLIGKEGTLIYIKANTFGLPEDTNQCIRVTLKERLKKSLIIRDNLTTITDENKILVSQAMFEINSSTPLNPGQNIVSINPVDEIRNDILPYDGNRDDNDMLHWVETNDSISQFPGPTRDFLFRRLCIVDTFSILSRDTLIRYNYTAYDTLVPDCEKFFCRLLSSIGFKRDTIRLDSFMIPIEYTKKLIDTIPRIDTVVCPPPISVYNFIPDTTTVEQVSKLSPTGLKNYVFNTNRLGWRNLDWLMKIKNRKDFIVYFDPDPNVEMKLIFKNYRSVVPLLPKDNYYWFPEAPVGEPAWLLAFKIQDGKAYVALEDVIIDKKGFKDLNFKEETIETIFSKLKVFDN